MEAIGPFKNSNSDLVNRFSIHWRPGRALRWKGEDRQLGRSESGVWKVGTFKTVAPTGVG
jgi:hypothetical protein